MFLPVFICLSVCRQDYSKTRAWIWMKCCVSTDVGTWTNRWTDLLWSPIRMPEPDCFLRCRMHCNAQLYYLWKIPRTGIGHPSLQRGMILFTASCGNTCVGGKCALPSALLVAVFIGAHRQADDELLLQYMEVIVTCRQSTQFVSSHRCSWRGRSLKSGS